MKFKKMLPVLLVSLIIGFVAACGGDDDNGGDPNEFCNIEACATNEGFRTVCIDEYNDCIALGGDPEDCRVAATETCTL